MNMDVNGLAEGAVVGTTVLGSVAYGLSLLFGQRQKAIEAANMRVQALQKEENAILTGKVDYLTDRVETLTDIIIRFICPKAATCKNRPQFDEDFLGSIGVNVPNREEKSV